MVPGDPGRGGPYRFRRVGGRRLDSLVYDAECHRPRTEELKNTQGDENVLLQALCYAG